jgi:outer membrane putative beta-barrel porin/alpha-amylase
MRQRVLLMAVAAVLVTAAPAVAEDRQWLLFSSSVNYTVGDYGTDKDTTIVYVPFTLGVSPIDRLWLSLTVPFIYQDTQNVVLTGGGVASRREQKGKLAKPSGSTTEEGLGDVLAKASFVVLREGTIAPEIEPYVKIKFPTADRDRGLGTGEFDETFGVDVSKNLVGDLHGYLTLAYTFIGDPPGSDLRDSFGWSLGAAYGIIPAVSVFAFLDGATSVAPGQDDPLELRMGAELRLTRVLKLTGSVTRGLSDGSPDWGVSAGLGLKF